MERVRIYTVPEVGRYAADLAAVEFGGYTMYQAEGGWQAPRAAGPTIEDVVVVEILVATRSAWQTSGFLAEVRGYAGAAGEAEILVTREHVEAEFVSCQYV